MTGQSTGRAIEFENSLLQLYQLFVEHVRRQHEKGEVSNDTPLKDDLALTMAKFYEHVRTQGGEYRRIYYQMTYACLFYHPVQQGEDYIVNAAIRWGFDPREIARRAHQDIRTLITTALGHS